MTYPQTVSEYLPKKWLSFEDLQNKSHPLTIDGQYWEEVWNRQEQKKVVKLTLSFKGAQKRLIPNSTQIYAIEAITKTDRFSEWIGHTIVLSPGKTHNGKDTIVISASVSQVEQMS
jgi:hypothetical protein